MDDRSLGRRKHPRTTKYHPQQLRIETGVGGRDRHGPQRGFGTVGAKLLDFSEGGVGLNVLTPLVIGSTVSLGVELHSLDSCKQIQGRARVVHCLWGEDQTYRVGLAFEDVEFRDLFCTHEAGFPVEVLD